MLIERRAGGRSAELVAVSQSQWSLRCLGVGVLSAARCVCSSVYS